MNFDECLERIKSLKGLKYDYQVAELLGLTKSALAERKSRNSLPLDKINIFCERNAVNMGWMLTGEGERSNDKAMRASAVDCALVDVFSLAGPDVERRLTGSRLSNGMAIPRGFVTDGIETIQLKGDSMEPCLQDGALLGIDATDRRLVNGNLYAVWLANEGAVIRRAYMGNERLTLKADNSRYSPVFLEGRAVIDSVILGRVKWVIQRF